MSFIKICGLTSLADAEAACAAGADAIGFVCAAASPRRVDPAEARQIGARISGPVLRVGVFVETPASGIGAVAAAGGFDVVQLHGEQPEAQIRELSGRLRIWAAVRVPPSGANLGEAERRVAALGDAVEAYLLDTAVPGQAGGTGRSFDWRIAGRLVEAAPTTRFLVAGGLTPANVADAIAQSNAWGVDVSSGVESSPGRKDAAKMRDFIAAARAAFAARRGQAAKMIR